MKVLMILSNPLIVDPRVFNEAKTLINNGHKVTVIVWDRHNNYKDEELIDGIRVVRIHNEKIMKILPNDLIRNPIWWRIAYKKALLLYRSGFKFNTVHCHDLDTLKTGVWLKKKFRINLIFDSHEIFGHMVSRTMPKSVVNYAFRMEKKLVKFVDFVIIAEKSYLDYFKSLGCKNIITLLNCKKLLIKKYKKNENKVFTVSYIGVLNRSRFFPESLEAIGNIENVKFLIAGKEENMYEEIKQLSKKYKNIEFLGWIPYDKVIPTTLVSDIVLCMINPEDINNKIASANKQFEAMVCGRPIICTKETRSGEITEDEKCGLVIEYNKKALREAIIKLRDNPKLCKELGKNALKAAIEKYNWELEENKLINLYEKMDVKNEK